MVKISKTNKKVGKINSFSKAAMRESLLVRRKKKMITIDFFFIIRKLIDNYELY